MGVIRNAANRKIRGRVGDTTYYVSMDRQIARQALNSSNYGESARRTEAQQNRRVRWSNLVNFYKLSKSWMPKAFESKRKGQTDYNRFMSVNVNTSTVALTKDQALQGGCVVESFVITQGSIPSVEVSNQESKWSTNLELGSLTITGSTTVAEFTRALIANNAHIQDGMQLSFVSYQQFVSNTGLPSVICTFYEVTLNSTSQNSLRDYLPDFCSSVVGTKLGTSDNVSIGAFAYILSDRSQGTIRVSSQSLVNNNASLIQLFSSAEQFSKAIASYGVDDEVVLSPISEVAQRGTEQPVGINSLYLQSSRSNVIDGDYVGDAGPAIYSNGWSINMSGLTGKTVTRLYVLVEDDSTERDASASRYTVLGNTINVNTSAFDSGSWLTKNLIKVVVELSSGDICEINFEGTEIHE